MSESAEAIAKVCADLKARRCIDIYDVEPPEGTWFAIEDAVVVDATAYYKDLQTRKEGVYAYEDHRVCPVWPNSLICYLNEHGNAVVMHTYAIDREEYDDTEWERGSGLWETDASTHVIDWDRIRWVYNITIFAGHRGQENTVAVPTAGPLYMYRLAVLPDGEINDIRWIAFDHKVHGSMISRWDMASLVTLGTINLGNCVNVELMEPRRSRHAARRLARTGVRVSELHVRPISKSYRGKRDGREPLGTVPIHSVRGHFAEYGVNGRGLLFGKYSGRFWIPSHARGNPQHGEVEQSYIVEP